MTMKLIRTTINHLLALLGQRRRDNDHSPSTIDILPEDVLLEVFGSYREILKRFCCRRSDAERFWDLTWNGKEGWLKLAHVCRKWRCIVLSSSFRLQTKLVFMLYSNQKPALLTRLPRLPIVIYAPGQLQKPKNKKRAVAALRYSDRVHKISLCAPDLMLDGVRRATSCPFPELKVLELYDWAEFNIPDTLFGGSVPSLRHLDLRRVSVASLSLLPSTPGLVYLKLKVDRPLQVMSLLTLLQGMPCLHHLDLHLPTCCPNPRTMPADVVHLSSLKWFFYRGHRRYLEALVAGLAAPFLQNFNIAISSASCSLPTPSLSRFIRDVEGSFLSVHVWIQYDLLIILKDSGTLDHVPRKIVVEDWNRIVQDSPGMLCAKLGTVEQVLFQGIYPTFPSNTKSWTITNATYWLGFFQQLQSVKIIKMQSGWLHDVARFFVQNGGDPPFRFLPALEEIELRPLDRESARINNDAWEEILSIFSPFISARQQAGRPVRISWNAVFR